MCKQLRIKDEKPGYVKHVNDLEHTKEWDTGRVGEMQRLAVFAKVLRTSHKPAHLLENSRCAPADLGPRPTKTMDRGSSEG